MRHNGRGRHTHSNQLEPHTKTSSATPAASQPIGTKAARSVHQGKQGAASAELPSTCENKQVHRRVGRGRDTHGKAIKTEPAGRSRKQDSGRQARMRETSREGEAIAEAMEIAGLVWGCYRGCASTPGGAAHMTCTAQLWIGRKHSAAATAEAGGRVHS